MSAASGGSAGASREGDGAGTGSWDVAGSPDGAGAASVRAEAVTVAGAARGCSEGLATASGGRGKRHARQRARIQAAAVTINPPVSAMTWAQETSSARMRAMPARVTSTTAPAPQPSQRDAASLKSRPMAPPLCPPMAAGPPMWCVRARAERSSSTAPARRRQGVARARLPAKVMAQTPRMPKPSGAR